jgi:hypothetical protein
VSTERKQKKQKKRKEEKKKRRERDIERYKVRVSEREREKYREIERDKDINGYNNIDKRIDPLSPTAAPLGEASCTKRIKDCKAARELQMLGL